jgi:hydrogenase nickel incorporation protein HypA/HybF
MHELAITQAILSVVLEAAEAAGARRVTAVGLTVGALTSYVDDSIRFYFELLSKGTLAEGALLRIRREPGEGRCQTCGGTFLVEPPLLPACPLCGSFGHPDRRRKPLYRGAHRGGRWRPTSRW